MKKRLLFIVIAITTITMFASVLSAAPSTGDAKKRIKKYWKTSYSSEKILKIKKAGKPYKKRGYDNKNNMIEKYAIPFKVKVKRTSDKRIYSISVWYARKGVYGKKWKFINIGVGDSKIIPGKAQKEPSKKQLKKLFINYVNKNHKLNDYPYSLSGSAKLFKLKLSKGKLRSNGPKFWYEYNADFTLIDKKKKKNRCTRNYSNFTVKKENASSPWVAEVSYPQNCD
jgi:hypothetical protein